ncbi:LOW QUALITY PROTEIN: WAT1-related protein At1g70260-like [Gastrolobium bilobum]|uniref:LOW QUALITY PROTEIN: WAT1-related protein At1g70260-like n=1 Tax=Gastrolobium bilobum TaxID=150636 RepID=UPI002AB2BC3A|nr:LOW QUALITY PROTEIN: WAT1-related protein At1g70260-like [Gastrolobium bilobum]
MSEVLPFIVMVIIEGCTIVGLTIFAKTAITNGMSPFVLIVYTNALATIILFRCSFFLHHEDRITKTQTFSFLGLSYSSPILVCAMGHLIPTFNFMLSVILRKTQLNLKSYDIQVQVIGILVSIMGAVLAELFKGPLRRPSSHHLQHTKQLFAFSSTPEFWGLGGILLAAASFSTALWNFIWKETAKQYTQPMKVVSYYSLLGTILSALISWIIERDANAWNLKHNMELILIVLTALFGGVIRPNVQVWLSRMKGPLYVPLFKPFSIAFATTFGVCFFPNSLHYGSVMGATIIGMEYYTIMYGLIKGGDEEEKSYDESSDSLDKKIPLLQEKMEV